MEYPNKDIEYDLFDILTNWSNDLYQLQFIALQIF